jgi:hypothetical protein
VEVSDRELTWHLSRSAPLEAEWDRDAFNESSLRVCLPRMGVAVRTGVAVRVQLPGRGDALMRNSSRILRPVFWTSLMLAISSAFPRLDSGLALDLSGGSYGTRAFGMGRIGVEVPDRPADLDAGCCVEHTLS